jgi:hypothetical protein
MTQMTSGRFGSSWVIVGQASTQMMESSLTPCLKALCRKIYSQIIHVFFHFSVKEKIVA